VFDPIELNVPVALSAYPTVVQAVLPEIAEATRNEIVANAQHELTSGGLDYVGGVQLLHLPVSPEAILQGPVLFASVVLTGWLPNALENGWAGGDMKPGLLGGRNAKVSKKGFRYNIVPFRHQTPGTSGRAGRPMGSTHRAHGMSGRDAKRLGRAIHAHAKNLSATTSHPRTGTAWGKRLSAGLAPKLTSHTGYRHKTDIFAGMVRQQKTYAAATQNTYSTFRVVSENSDPDSWHHPGIVRHDFFGRAAKKVPKIAGLLFRGAIEGIALDSSVKGNK